MPEPDDDPDEYRRLGGAVEGAARTLMLGLGFCISLAGSVVLAALGKGWNAGMFLVVAGLLFVTLMSKED